MSDPLIGALDKGAERLLELMMADGRNADGTPSLTTLTERVKAFDAVVAWARVKLDIAPPPPERSKFDALRDDFLGSTPPPDGGRVAGKAKKARPKSGVVHDDGEYLLAVAPPANGSDPSFLA